MQQPAQLVLHPVPNVRHMPTLRPMATFHPILSKLLTLKNYPTPLQAAAFRQPSIRINMRIHRFPIHPISFLLWPILIQCTLGIHLVQIDQLLLPQYNMRRRPQRSRA